MWLFLVHSCSKSLPQVFTLSCRANPAKPEVGAFAGTKTTSCYSQCNTTMLYIEAIEGGSISLCSATIASKRFVPFTMLQVPKPISWVHKKK